MQARSGHSFHASANRTCQRKPNCFRATLAVAVMVCWVTTVCEAGSSRLIQVSDGSTSWVGKVVALNETECSLVDRFGAIVRLPVKSLRTFEVVSDRFEAAPAAEVREQLRKEFPSDFEISGSTHFLVCGPKGKSQTYARLFEESYRSVEHFFRVRGFTTNEPETALIGLVFGSQQEFADYCRRDNVVWSPGLRGYYSLTTNRVALFDSEETVQSAEPRGTDRTALSIAKSDGVSVPSATVLPPTIAARVGTSNAAVSTIIHEATHQVGHNIGIHSRTTSTPTWIIEGLATMLESPGQRGPSAGRTLKTRLNSERHNWFNGESASRRQPGDVAKLIASDEPFRNQPLDSYSNSWALMFYMAESPARTQKFIRYLRMVRDRHPSAEYTADDRLRDFEAVFGDIARLEVEFLRYMDRME